MILEKQLRRFARRCWVTTRRHPLLPFLLAATLALTSLDLFCTQLPYVLHFSLLLTAIIHFFLLGIWISHSLREVGYRLGVVLAVASIYLHLSGLPEDQRWAAFGAILLVAFLVPLSVQVIIHLVKKKDIRFRVVELLLLMTSSSVLAWWIQEAILIDLMYDYWFYFNNAIKIGLLPSIALSLYWYLPPMKNLLIRTLLISSMLFVIPLLQTCSLAFFNRNYKFFDLVEVVTQLFLYMLLPCSLLWVWILLWSFGLQYKSRPTRRKREQAALALPEQPVRLHNQDVDQLSSAEATDPDSNSKDESSGPIDLRV